MLGRHSRFINAADLAKRFCGMSPMSDIKVSPTYSPAKSPVFPQLIIMRIKTGPKEGQLSAETCIHGSHYFVGGIKEKIWE